MQIFPKPLTIFKADAVKKGKESEKNQTLEKFSFAAAKIEF